MLTTKSHRRSLNIYIYIMATSWRKRLGARLPPLGSRVRVSVTPCGFRGGRNEIWVGFSRGFSRLPLPQLSFHHFSTLTSSISFHFIRPCDGASGVVGRHPCYSRGFIASHPSTRPCVGHELRIFNIYVYIYIYIYNLFEKNTKQY